MEKVNKKLRLLTILISLTLFLSLLTFANGIVISSKLNKGAVAVPSAPSNNGGRVVPTGKPVAVSADNDAVRGDKNAPVTIIEFSDFQCPYCGRFFKNTLPQLQKEYIDTGKVKLVYRDFPLSFHPHAEKAAEAAECAKDQGGDKVFFKMHDLIFNNQDTMSVSSYKSWAAQLGLDTAKFNSCLDSGEKAAEIKADFQAGQAAGVSGTPSFFINGIKLVGAQPFSAFKPIIDAQLKA